MFSNNIIYLISKIIVKIKTLLSNIFILPVFFLGFTKLSLRVVWLSLKTAVLSTPKRNEQLSVVIMYVLHLLPFKNKNSESIA